MQCAEPAHSGVACEQNSQHAPGGYQLHPATAAPHPGLSPLLPHTQRPFRWVVNILVLNYEQSFN